MSWWIVVSIGLLLGWIIIQDFRERRISLVALMLLFVFGIVISCLALTWVELTKRIFVNSLFAGLILVSGTLLVKIRRRKDPVSSFIGAGDFLFLLAISPLFTFGSYLVFLNTSIILVLVFFGMLLLTRKIRFSETIPLAGGLAICLMLFLIIDLLASVSLLESVDWIYTIIG